MAYTSEYAQNAMNKVAGGGDKPKKKKKKNRVKTSSTNVQTEISRKDAKKIKAGQKAKGRKMSVRKIRKEGVSVRF